MKKVILILIILILGFLTGCGSGLHNLNLFTIPDDAEFLVLIQELNTPEIVCQYMRDNFTYEPRILNILTPYELYLIKEGDCDDMSNFAIFFTNHHNYETWQIKIFYNDTIYYHVIAVFKENNKYNFSDNQYYFSINATSFKEIVEYDYSLHSDKIWTKYIVYDYDNKLIETGYND